MQGIGARSAIRVRPRTTRCAARYGEAGRRKPRSERPARRFNLGLCASPGLEVTTKKSFISLLRIRQTTRGRQSISRFVARQPPAIPWRPVPVAGSATRRASPLGLDTVRGGDQALADLESWRHEPRECYSFTGLIRWHCQRRDEPLFIWKRLIPCVARLWLGNDESCR